MPDVRLEDVPESDRLYEIVNGKKVWLPLRSIYSCIVAHKLVERLHAYSEDWTRGDAYINMPYEVPVGSNTVRRPSGSYVSAARLRARGPLDPLREGNPVVPDLVIESLGKDDLADYTMDKVHQYLASGVPLVWIIFPRSASSTNTRRQMPHRGCSPRPTRSTAGSCCPASRCRWPGFSLPSPTNRRLKTTNKRRPAARFAHFGPMPVCCGLPPQHVQPVSDLSPVSMQISLPSSVPTYNGRVLSRMRVAIASVSRPRYLPQPQGGRA